MDQEEKLVENNKPAEISDRENQFPSRAQRYRGEKTATGIGVENDVKITQDPNQDDVVSIRPVHSNRICVLQVLADDQKMYKRFVNGQWVFWQGVPRYRPTRGEVIGLRLPSEIDSHRFGKVFEECVNKSPTGRVALGYNSLVEESGAVGPEGVDVPVAQMVERMDGPPSSEGFVDTV